MMTRMTGRDKDMRGDDMDMRSAPYRSSGGYNDRAGVMRMGGRNDYRRDDARMGGRDEDYMRMSGSRYYPDERVDGYAPEMRRGRDSRGRYTSARMGGYNEPWMGEDDDMEMRTNPRRVYFPQMNRKIGFSVDGEMERIPDEMSTDYRSTIDYPQMNEMEHRKGTKAMSGHASGTGAIPFTKEMAMEWMEGLENADGSHGPHWTMDQVKNVMAQKNIEARPLDFWVAMNIMFSDYSAVAKKMNVNTMDFYTCMAKAFLDDSDAREDKLSRYYESVVK